MATIKFKLANTSDFSNNFASILLGKNGFQTTFGSIPLLANSISVVNPTDARPDGNLRFTVVGFDQLHDYNFEYWIDLLIFQFDYYLFSCFKISLK